MSQPDQPGTAAGKKAAGAFDVRNMIAALIGFYGVVLVVVGLVDTGEEALEKTGGVQRQPVGRPGHGRRSRRRSSCGRACGRSWSSSPETEDDEDGNT